MFVYATERYTLPMKINQKIFQRWIDAGLTSQDQTDAMLDYESSNSPNRSNWIIWGIATIGIAAILIGIISIVAAKWDKISPGIN